MNRFVRRGADGKVNGDYNSPQPGIPVEELPDDHPDLVAFNNPPAPTDDEVVDRVLTTNRAFRALVRVFAAYTQNPQPRTAAQIIASVKQQMM